MCILLVNEFCNTPAQLLNKVQRSWLEDIVQSIGNLVWWNGTTPAAPTHKHTKTRIQHKMFWLSSYGIS